MPRYHPTRHGPAAEVHSTASGHHSAEHSGTQRSRAEQRAARDAQRAARDAQRCDEAPSQALQPGTPLREAAVVPGSWAAPEAWRNDGTGGDAAGAVLLEDREPPGDTSAKSQVGA